MAQRPWPPPEEGGDEQEEAPWQAQAPAVAEPVWAALPWLLDTELPPAKPTRRSRGAASSAGPASSSSEGEDREEQPDFDPTALLDALYERRHHWGAAEGSRTEAFRWVIRGGEWTARRRGVAYDSIRGQPCGKRPAQWATSYGLQTTATFATSKYGEDMAMKLAICWCHKMDRLFELFQAGGEDPAFVYSLAGLAVYREPPEAAELDAGPSAVSRDRLGAIRAVLPRGAA